FDGSFLVEEQDIGGGIDLTELTHWLQGQKQHVVESPGSDFACEPGSFFALADDHPQQIGIAFTQSRGTNNVEQVLFFSHVAGMENNELLACDSVGLTEAAIAGAGVNALGV